MKNVSLALIALFASVSFAGGVLFVDLNNSLDEIAACEKGVREHDVRDCNSPDECISVVTSDDNNSRVSAASVRNKIVQMARQGKCVDTIVISGHDGSGDFFGENGRFKAGELTQIMKEYPEVSSCLTSAVLWGCYPTNVNGCETFWLKNTGPHVKVAAGFTLQSPDNTKNGNFALLHDYCQKRAEPVNAQNEQEMNHFFKHLAGVNNWQFGICTETGLCSMEYKNAHDKSRDPSCFHTYEELHTRCGEFDPDRSVTNRYNQYLGGTAPGFENPPPDSESVFSSSGQLKGTKKSELRMYYDQVHLWRHCAEAFKKATTPFTIPQPAQVIRLVKFADWKRNFAQIEKPEIDQYNQKLRDLGLFEQYALDPEHQSRGEMNRRTSGAVAALQMMSRQSTPMAAAKPLTTASVQSLNDYDDTGVMNLGPSSLAAPTPAARASAPVIGANGTDPAKVLVMAKGFDRTERALDWTCSDFTWVHESTAKSPCIKPYGAK